VWEAHLGGVHAVADHARVVPLLRQVAHPGRHEVQIAAIQLRSGTLPGKGSADLTSVQLVGRKAIPRLSLEVAPRRAWTAASLPAASRCTSDVLPPSRACQWAGLCASSRSTQTTQPSGARTCTAGCASFIPGPAACSAARPAGQVPEPPLGGGAVCLTRALRRTALWWRCGLRVQVWWPQRAVLSRLAQVWTTTASRALTCWEQTLADNGRCRVRCGHCGHACALPVTYDVRHGRRKLLLETSDCT